MSDILRDPFSKYLIYVDEFCQNCGRAVDCRCPKELRADAEPTAEEVGEPSKETERSDLPR